MTIEAMPIGVRCNLKCTYCYQDPVRNGDQKLPQYSVPVMKATLEAEWKSQGSSRSDAAYIVFGGEPLMIPIADLEEFLKHSFELSGSSGLQTNAALMTEAHIELFKRYNTHVGVSLDGPGELNDARASETLEATRATTEKSNAALLRLLEEKISCSVILTLHRGNASKDRLPRLAKWMTELHAAGLDGIKLHLMEVDDPKAQELALPDKELIAALITLHQAEPMLGPEFVVFSQMLDLLRGDDRAVDCIWNACDPGTTTAVRAVGPEGERLNCARTYKTPVTWEKAEKESYARQLALYATPHEDGGCKGCRFFLACKGQCPGEAIGGDPRNRSSRCEVWFTVFEFLEKRLLETRVVPISLRPDREALESLMLSEWAENRRVSIHAALAILEGRTTIRTDLRTGEHADWHNDHQDQSRKRIKV